MLDPNAITAAIVLSQSLAEQGVSLRAIPDTAVGLLVRETPTHGLTAADVSYDQLTTSLVDLSREGDHAELMATVVANATGAVRKTLDYTRNTVMPHIRRVMDAYAVKMEALSILPLPYNFNFVYQPDVYSTGAARELLERWESLPTLSSPGEVALGSFTPDEIVELCAVTQQDDFNELIEELLKSNGGKGLTEISEVLAGTRAIDHLDPIYGLPMCVVLQGIEQPKDGVAMTLSRYNAVRTVLANIAAKMALNVINRMSVAGKTSNVYHSVFSKDANNVDLSGEVYRDLLERGLTVEALIGNELLGRKYRGEALIASENLAEMQEVYNRDKAVRQEAHALNRQQLSRKAVRDVLREDQLAMAESGEWIIEGDSAERSWLRLRTFVDAVMKSAWQSADPAMLISATVCGIWYAHTDAARMIDIMLQVETANSRLPAKEIATLATLRYIAEWVAAQIDTVMMTNQGIVGISE